jgi:adenosine kinase
LPTRIAILGAIVYDEIITHDAQRIESFGGIVYNVAALSSFIEDGIVMPVSNVGEDRRDQVLALMAGMENVDTSELLPTDRPCTHARLIYHGANFREEIVHHMMPPFTIERLESAANADGILINFVNGTELDLTTLRALRKRTAAPLYLDMHNIMVRFDAEGQKQFLDFAEWPEWVEQFDFVQMNEFECEKVLQMSPGTPKEFLHAAQTMLAAGTKAVAITMGPAGVALAHRRDGIEYGCIVPAVTVRNFVDATGCGDAFSTGTFWHYLRTGNPLRATMAGALVGAVNCEVRGIGKLERARNADQRIAEVSPELADRVEHGWLGERLS